MHTICSHVGAILWVVTIVPILAFVSNLRQCMIINIRFTIRLVSKSLSWKTPEAFLKMKRKAFKPYLLTLGRCTESWGFSRWCCIRSISVCQINFDPLMSSGANDQANILQFAAIRDHSCRHVAVFPSWTHVLITKLFQPTHNCVIPTVKEQSELNWCKAMALINVHQFIQNVKYYAPLQWFAWCIAGFVLQLLKPTLFCFMRKMWTLF